MKQTLVEAAQRQEAAEEQIAGLTASLGEVRAVVVGVGGVEVLPRGGRVRCSLFSRFLSPFSRVPLCSRRLPWPSLLHLLFPHGRAGWTARRRRRRHCLATAGGAAARDGH